MGSEPFSLQERCLPARPSKVNMRAPARDGRSFGRSNVQEMLNKINQITEASHG